MSTGYAIIVGEGAADGWSHDEQNPACDKDARDMAAFAKDRGFKLLGPSKNGTRQETPFFSDTATKQAIEDVIKEAAGLVDETDILLVYFSGHGAWLPRGDSGEKAQVVCLKDDYLWDYEWNDLLKEFPSGTRVLSVVDSCYGAGFGPFDAATPPQEIGVTNCPKPRSVKVSQTVWNAQKAKFAALPQRANGKKFSAEYLQLSACQANQLACTGKKNGLFTAVLLKLVEANPNLSYQQLHRAIVSEFRATQSPAYYSRGTADDEFGKEIAFSIDARAAV